MADINERENLIARLAARTRCKNVLRPDEIGRGAHLCWSNAASLLQDARTLAGNGAFARALSLSVLALEELAKPPMLAGVSSSDDPTRWAEFWKKEFSRHSSKQEVIGTYGQILDLIGQSTYFLRLRPTTVDALDSLKQWGFYVDCVDGAFQSPDEFAAGARDVLDVVFAFAEERADSFAQFHVSAEQSSRFLLALSNAPKPVWPPPISSDHELEAQLLSLASKYSITNPPNYIAFSDGCDQLGAAVGQEMFDRALDSTGRLCARRGQFRALPTSAARGQFMLKLCLFGIPENERATVIQRWKDDLPGSAG